MKEPERILIVGHNGDSATYDGKELPENGLEPPTQTTADDWKDRLQYEVMENYLFEAQLTDKVIDKADHMEEMRKHWQKLLSFIEEEKAQAKREVLKNLLELKWITESQVDNYSLYHGLSTEEEK